MLLEFESHFERDLSPELVFYTITLKPRLYKFQALTQYELTINDLRKLLMGSCTKSCYSVELTDAGNVHYHGIALFRDRIRRLCFIDQVKRAKSFGFVKLTNNAIETKDQLTRSICYISKDLATTTKIICRKGWNPPLIQMVI